MKVNSEHVGSEHENAEKLLFKVAKERRGSHSMPRPERKRKEEDTQLNHNLKKEEVENMHKHEKCKPEQSFHAVDGGTYYSIQDLADALDIMSDDTFFYHVTDSKNDFRSWLKDVFEETQLADKLVLARTKERMQIAVLRHLLGK